MSKIQLVAVVSAILLFVMLLFANTTPIESKEDELPIGGALSFVNIVEATKKSLPENKKSRLLALESELDQAGRKTAVLDSIIRFWSLEKKPSIAAFYEEQMAVAINTYSAWAKAADRYYNAARFTAEAERPLIYEAAIKCYKKALELNPQDLNLQAALGICYVEGSANPMDGITLLRGVVAKDSTNINAQLNLGLFSIKSGQYEKAIDRFKKVISIEPTYIEAYLYLADCYEKTNNKELAIEALMKYEKAVDDPAVKTEIQNYIHQLKTI